MSRCARNFTRFASQLLVLCGRLHRLFPLGRGVPIVKDLGADNGVGQTGHGVRDNDQVVTRLLDGREDARHTAGKQEAHGDGRELAGAAVLFVLHNLNQLQDTNRIKSLCLQRKNRQIVRIAGWLIDWSIDPLIGWLVDWLIDPLIGWLIASNRKAMGFQTEIQLHLRFF